MKTIGNLREQDINVVEGNAVLVLSLIESVRFLERQLAAVDQALGAPYGVDRVGRIKALQEAQGDPK